MKKLIHLLRNKGHDLILERLKNTDSHVKDILTRIIEACRKTCKVDKKSKFYILTLHSSLFLFFIFQEPLNYTTKTQNKNNKNQLFLQNST